VNLLTGMNLTVKWRILANVVIQLQCFMKFIDRQRRICP